MRHLPRVTIAEKNALEFDVLSDPGNVVGRSFGLVYALPEELRAAMRLNGKALPGINGDESWELPLPATFVIAQHRRIALAYVDVDYRVAWRRKTSSPRCACWRGQLPAAHERRCASRGRRYRHGAQLAGESLAISQAIRSSGAVRGIHAKLTDRALLRQGNFASLVTERLSVPY